MRKPKPEDALLLLAVLAGLAILAYLFGLMPSAIPGSGSG
jgi:hypothetical protein